MTIIVDTSKIESESALETSTSLTELAVRKKVFLDKLASPSGKTKYKRYVGSPLRYAGGKSLAVGLIVELIPDSTKRVVSPFMGGGSVEVAIALELKIPVVGYDIFDILMNYWDVQFLN